MGKSKKFSFNVNLFVNKKTVIAGILSLVLVCCLPDMLYADYSPDLDGSETVDITDLNVLATYWLDGCSDPNWCDEVDMNLSGKIDLIDYELLSQYWQQGLVEFEETFYAIASEDGRIYDDNTGNGDIANESGNIALRLGDAWWAAQTAEVGYKNIVSFNTSTFLPCEMLSAKLQLTRGDQEGDNNPFDWGGSCDIDIAAPSFGAPALEHSDWNAASDANAVASFVADPGTDGLPMVSGEFNQQGKNGINTDGKTQLRIYMTNLNNDDGTNDFIGLYSGEEAIADKRPKLTVRYIVKKPYTIFESTGIYDGRIYDSDDDGNGDSADVADDDGDALRVGDYYFSGNLNYRTILSFNTSDLPDNCIINAAKLQLTRGVAEGVDPFTWGGSCDIDIVSPSFNLVGLEINDFQAVADGTAVASFAGPDPGENETMMSSAFDATGLSNINKIGTTQLRVYFTTPYKSGGNDYLGFYSGENTTAEYRPKLIIQYTPVEAPPSP